MTSPSVCILPELKKTGGPSSFQSKLKDSLSKRGVQAHHDISRKDTSVLLITGATRDLYALLESRRRGIKIVQRLDGMNWLHKRYPTGWRHYLRSERMNWQLAFIRRWFADVVVYQSAFTQDWWNSTHGLLAKPSTVIHNGVDLDIFKPSRVNTAANEPIRVLVVEGSFEGGHERDLHNAVAFANHLSEKVEKKVELAIAGRVPDSLRKQIPTSGSAEITWLGLVPNAQIPDLDRSAHLFFPAEINAACPNAVVEAMACGLPVVGYATGSIPELVGEESGAIVPYNSNYWKLETPDTESLASAAANVMEALPQYRSSARKRAEQFFGLDMMVDAYLKILLEK